MPFEAYFDDKGLIPQFQKVIGGVPEKWVQDAFSNGVLKESIDGEAPPVDWILAKSGKNPLEKALRHLSRCYENHTLVPTAGIHFSWVKENSKFLDDTSGRCWSLIPSNERRRRVCLLKHGYLKLVEA